MRGDLLRSSSPFPTVDPKAPNVPSPGIVIATPTFCSKVFGRGKCAGFYREMAEGEPGGPRQCPYGFAAWRRDVAGGSFVVTGLVPAPRMGGNAEAQRAGTFPASKVRREAVQAWLEEAVKLVQHLDEAARGEVGRRLRALHEVRRFNQVIKTVMERSCLNESPADPDKASPDLVRAWKASELVSVHLDALDVLANPDSIRGIQKHPTTFYKIVDMVSRIYRPMAQEKGVVLQLSGRSEAKVQSDGRTLHIVPSALIDNAIKYSDKGGRIDVCVGDSWRDGKRLVSVTVENDGPSATRAEEQKFFVGEARGELAKKRAEGSGLGLRLANVVAGLHGGRLSHEQRALAAGRARWRFCFEMEAGD